jgi:FlaA1/EpsC-like NDP-sugar epimerase
MNIASLGRHLATLPASGKLALMLVADGLLLPVCAFLAVLLGPIDFPTSLALAPWPYLIAGWATIPILAATGLYRSVVRFIDLKTVASTSLGLACVVAMLYGLVLWLDIHSVPAASLLLYWFVAFTYLMTSRLVARSVLQIGMKRPGKPRRRTLIYGAGSAGVQLAHAMAFSLEYQVGAFADDDPKLHGKIVSGHKVYRPDELQKAIERHDIEQIVVAIPSAPISTRRALIARVEALGLPVKTLPGLVDLVDGEASVSAIRDIDVSDLLGRDAVPPEPALFARNTKGKVVLVTGAGGSIGSELCRQILSQQPTKLVLLEHSEFALYCIEQELLTQRADCDIVGVLMSVQDETALMTLMQAHQVDTVYHAAAYKHVPIVEVNIRQGVMNNVFGTLAVARAAQHCELETCVLISTDKAVRPTNVMGASKRIAELIFQAFAARGAKTVFSMVRFGNVLGSSGSVVPLFKKQIQAGGPITITHPDIIRYFMLIPEAAQLVIQAGAMARGGEVFVLDMGEPVKIAGLARAMIRLSGLMEKTEDNPDGDIEIRFVGLRPGEKLYEELLIGNDPAPSGHPRIMCAHERHIDPVLLDKMLASLRHACDIEDTETVVRLVHNLVPEYRSPAEVNGTHGSASAALA